MLGQTLADVRKRIAQSPKDLNETNTKATLIEPVIAALGWNILDASEVVREHRADHGNPVDYALVANREPKLYLEAKPLGANLDDSKIASQIMGYAGVAGVEWIVVTNGDEWRIYNAHAAVPIQQKLLRAVRIADHAGGAEQVLSLIAKEQLKSKLIDELWHAHFIDRRVKEAFEKLVGSDHDKALVQSIRAFVPDLSPAEIRSSLQRCQPRFDIPPVTALDPRPSAPLSPGSDTVQADGTSVSIAELMRAGVLKAPLMLTATYKTASFSAELDRDGRVSFAGCTYPSLSAAGSAALASAGGLTRDGEQRAVNGWDFWRYIAADGQVRPIAHARHEFATRQSGSNGN